MAGARANIRTGSLAGHYDTPKATAGNSSIPNPNITVATDPDDPKGVLALENAKKRVLYLVVY